MTTPALLPHPERIHNPVAQQAIKDLAARNIARYGHTSYTLTDDLVLVVTLEGVSHLLQHRSA